MISAAELIGPTEAGKILGYHRTHVVRLIKSGTIPAQRTPLGHLMERSTIAALARQREGAQDNIESIEGLDAFVDVAERTARLPMDAVLRLPYAERRRLGRALQAIGKELLRPGGADPAVLRTGAARLEAAERALSRVVTRRTVTRAGQSRARRKRSPSNPRATRRRGRKTRRTQARSSPGGGDDGSEPPPSASGSETSHAEARQ
jgi:hypothetical protein